MQPDVEAEMDCGLEQLSAVMMDQEHIEIKAVIQLNLMAFFAAENTEHRRDYRRAFRYGRITEPPRSGWGYIAKGGR